MGPPSYIRSVVDRNVVMRRMTTDRRRVIASQISVQYNIQIYRFRSAGTLRHIVQIPTFRRELAASIFRDWQCRTEPRHGGTALLKKNR